MDKTIGLVVEFCREYYQKNFGNFFTFDRKYFLNIDKRIEIETAKEKKYYERFGDLGLGSPKPQPRIFIGFDDTLNITAIFGGNVKFESNYTWLEPGTLKTDEDIYNLKVPKIEGTWPHTLFIKQFEQCLREYKPDLISTPSVHGILECAMDLMGEQFLISLVDRPILAEKLLDVMTETVIRVKEFWDKKKYGRVQKTPIHLGGCSSKVLSPELLERYIVPRYNYLTNKYGGALCACGGVTTQQLSSFAKIENCKAYRLGWGTDFKKARELLCDVHILASLDPVRICRENTEDVERDVVRLVEEAGNSGPLTIVLNNADAETPEENIRTIFATIKKFGKINLIRW